MKSTTYIAIICCFLLLASFTFAADVATGTNVQTDSTAQSGGFFARLWHTFVGDSTKETGSTGPQANTPDSNGKDSATNPTNQPTPTNCAILVCKGPEGELKCPADYQTQCLAKFGKENCRCADSTTPPSPNVICNGALVCKGSEGEIKCPAESQTACLAKFGKDACHCVDSTTPSTPPPTAQPPVCSVCNAVVCKTNDKTFICPSTSLAECSAKFGSCQQPGCPQTTTPPPNACKSNRYYCYNPPTTAGTNSAGGPELAPARPVLCEGADCLAKYKVCTCAGEACTATTNLCLQRVLDPNCPQTNGGDSAVTGSNAGIVACTKTVPVQCQGSYVDCTAKYGECKCGVPADPHVNNTPTMCVEGDIAYQIGQSWKIDCNTCSCTKSGKIECTHLACTKPTECTSDLNCAQDEKCIAQPCSAIGANCPSVCVKTSTPKYCTQNGAYYQAGQSWKVDCNTCSCTDGGKVVCTTLACPVQTCTIGNKTYKVGESFPSSDGCNSCTCTENGAIACTMRACAPNTGVDPTTGAATI